MRQLKIIIIVAVLLILAGARMAPVFAYVMQSTDYRIQRDSINIGGADGTSTDYNLQDTVGEVGSGMSTSTSFALNAGYQQLEYISLTVPSSTLLSPSITGLSGGTATGLSDINVATNNATGYSLEISASTSPAMKLLAGSGSFSDYAPAGSDPDFTWSMPNTSSAFGFSPEGPDVIARYLDNGSACNQTGGTDTAGACWDGFSTSPKIVSQSASANEPNGTTTTVRMQAESGSHHSQAPGHYRAEVVVTAYMN